MKASDLDGMDENPIACMESAGFGVGEITFADVFD